MTPKPVRVGLVTDVGGLNDKSFNTLANQGRLDAEKDLGVQTSVVESKKQEDYVPNLTTFAQQGYDLVISVGFLMTNATWKVAKQFPNIKFGIIDGAPANDKGDTENLPNVANLFFAEQEAGYLVGVIAATMARDKVGAATHNTVCAMGGIPIPPVDKFIAGYQDAVKTVSPTTTILNGYSNDFVDQQKGKEVGLNHIGKGCDILFQVAGARPRLSPRREIYATASTRTRRARHRHHERAQAREPCTAPRRRSRTASSRPATSSSRRNDGVGYGKLAAIVPAGARRRTDPRDIKAARPGRRRHSRSSSVVGDTAGGAERPAARRPALSWPPPRDPRPGPHRSSSARVQLVSGLSGRRLRRPRRGALARRTTSPRRHHRDPSLAALGRARLPYRSFNRRAEPARRRDRDRSSAVRDSCPLLMPLVGLTGIVTAARGALAGGSRRAA